MGEHLSKRRGWAASIILVVGMQCASLLNGAWRRVDVDDIMPIERYWRAITVPFDRLQGNVAVDIGKSPHHSGEGQLGRL